MAHVAELTRFRVAGIIRIVDGFGGPNSNVAIAAGRRKTLAIGRDMAAVDLEIFLLAAVAQPRGLYDVHLGGARRMGFGSDAEHSAEGKGLEDRVWGNWELSLLLGAGDAK
jgi:hypothetical protein